MRKKLNAFNLNDGFELIYSNHFTGNIKEWSIENRRGGNGDVTDDPTVGRGNLKVDSGTVSGGGVFALSAFSISPLAWENVIVRFLGVVSNDASISTSTFRFGIRNDDDTNYVFFGANNKDIGDMGVAIRNASGTTKQSLTVGNNTMILEKHDYELVINGENVDIFVDGKADGFAKISDDLFHWSVIADTNEPVSKILNIDKIEVWAK